jgi:deoxycytidylate deaminase
MTVDEAKRLIARDAENEDKHGQQTRKTFELADAWVKDEDQLCRVLDLVFGNTFQTPTDDEDGMALAYAAALRSSDLSRQVGAAIVSPTGEVLATGRNEVPAPGGGQYSPPAEGIPTARDCDVGVDSNTKQRLKIEGEIADLVEKHVRAEFKELEDALDGERRKKLTEKLAQVRRLVSIELSKTSLRDITEYGRAVHAEMSALMSAARIGASVRGGILYCTTFPCHTCAKHLAAAGIARVVFVEPYPKSKAGDLHGDAITLVGESADQNPLSQRTASLRAPRTRFEPFLGVGPRRYFDLFSMKLGTGRSIARKDDSGNVLAFTPGKASPRVPLATTTYLEEEIEAAGILQDAKELKGKPRP